MNKSLKIAGGVGLVVFGLITISKSDAKKKTKIETEIDTVPDGFFGLVFGLAGLYILYKTIK